MHICLIIDNPETPAHPVIGEVLRRLGAAHHVRLLDVRTLNGPEALAQETRGPQADLYLLKSHAPRALELARLLEQQGALVVNTWEASLACSDRTCMAQRIHDAGLLRPATLTFTSLESLLEQQDTLAARTFPCIIKSRYSRRGDLVARVEHSEELRAFMSEWSQEPIILQEFVNSNGWDIKLWVIDSEIFAARRRSPLEAKGLRENRPLARAELPEEWLRIAREVGRAFKLRLYGIDMLESAHGPQIIDVNAFPGFRNVPGASEALLALIERIAREQEIGV